jgi:hypothetical protein
MAWGSVEMFEHLIAVVKKLVSVLDTTVTVLKENLINFGLNFLKDLGVFTRSLPEPWSKRRKAEMIATRR